MDNPAPWDNKQIFEYAVEALKSMLAEKGPDFKFPSDLIWQYVPSHVKVEEEIPSPARPHQPKRLTDAGYLEKTGGMTRAQSPQRAGSTTAEYRFGPKLVPRATVAAASAPTSSSERLKEIQSVLETEGYIISPAELANFYLAMTVSPLVILSGISGTGKSLLPRKFARLTDAAFRAIPVQPQWSDNRDLLGYVPTLAPTTYVDGALTQSLLQARAEPGRLTIALLDEMNLAPVEHYFSDFLSVAETRSRVGGRVSTDPLPIELPTLNAGVPDPYAKLRGIALPPNMRVVGTANMDETTHNFSPKVLDRAFTIEFDDPLLTDFAAPASGTPTKPDPAAFKALANQMISDSNPISIMEAQSESQTMFEYVAGLLSEVQEILAPAGVKFGYRTRDAILLYLHFWRKYELSSIMTGYAALDFCILQKILPKIAGSGETLSASLKKLSDWLSSREMPATNPFPEFTGKLERSARKTERMAALLDLDGATRYWGA